MGRREERVSSGESWERSQRRRAGLPGELHSGRRQGRGGLRMLVGFVLPFHVVRSPLLHSVNLPGAFLCDCVPQSARSRVRIRRVVGPASSNTDPDVEAEVGAYLVKLGLESAGGGVQCQFLVGAGGNAEERCKWQERVCVQCRESLWGSLS